MGLLKSLIAIVVALVLGYALGGPAGAFLGAFLLFLLSRFVFRQASVGLFKANLRAYWLARASGLAHDAGLAAVIDTRYRLEPMKQVKVRTELTQVMGRLDTHAWSAAQRQAYEAQTLVWLIFCNENGVPPTEPLKQRFWSQLLAQYQRFEVQYHRAGGV